jgi:hypothetical protein
MGLNYFGKMNPRFPVYIVSKGRAYNGLTTRALNEMKVPHYIVVEENELQDYKNGRCFGTLLVLPMKYKQEYELCDEHGLSKSTGPGPARNFCIDHSNSNGFSHHWVMDDNIDAFHYLTNNEKHEIRTGSTLLAAEDFVTRYSNVPVSGLNYYSFCKKIDSVPPYVLNTRIYSCLFIENKFGYRWRGRYNEDTDLSLRVLKDGLCTIQFNAFLCGKITTQRMKGGNTDEFYQNEGTLPKSQMLVKLHPDVSKVVFRFNRWHHHVDYSSFKKNKLIKKEGLNITQGICNYGMVLKPIS